jgi:hypothetical protein
MLFYVLEVVSVSCYAFLTKNIIATIKVFKCLLKNLSLFTSLHIMLSFIV